MSTPPYQGVWRNYETGRLVLTLDSLSAGFLSALLVTWVHFVAVATWSIIRYAFWSAPRRRDKSHDVFYAQRQVLLRNSDSSSSAFSSVLRLAIPWGGQNKRFILRALPFLLLSLVVSLAWVACGLFVPYIYTHSGAGMLLTTLGPCGIRSPISNNVSETLALDSYTLQLANRAQVYVQQCYNSTSSNSSQCSTYPRPWLPFHTTTDAPCPSTNSTNCITTNSTPILFDTGPLNSNYHFGINAPPAEQIDYRRTMSCSPVNHTSFSFTFNTTSVNGSAYFPPDPILFTYDFGPAAGENWTLQISDFQAWYQESYDVFAAEYFVGESDQYWYPSKALFNSNDTDATIMLVQGRQIKYLEPVYDPIFSAGLFPDDVLEYTVDGDRTTTYRADSAVTALLCTEQHSICAAGDTSRCTPPVGSSQLLNASFVIEGGALNAHQIASAFRLTNALIYSNFMQVINGRGESALLASQTLEDQTQTLLIPDNQWQLEVENLFSVSLALLQDNVLTFAAGISDSSQWQYVKDPDFDPLLKAQCKTQRAPPIVGFTNFDFSAVLAVLIVGTFLILLGFFFDKLVYKLARVLRWRRVQQHHHDWVAESTLQLHRVALEAKHGVGDWSDSDEDVPRSVQKIWPRIGITSDIAKGKDKDGHKDGQVRLDVWETDDAGLRANGGGYASSSRGFQSHREQVDGFGDGPFMDYDDMRG